MSPEFVIQLILAVAAAGGVYAAIKADLTRAILLAERADAAAAEAHSRIDRHLEVVK